MTEAASLPQGELTTAVVHEGAQATLRLKGSLDLDTVWALGAELSTLIRSGRQHLVLDLSGCTTVSPVCVGVLNRTVGELSARHGALSLRGATDSVVRRLRSAGLHPAVRTSSRHLDLL